MREETRHAWPLAILGSQYVLSVTFPSTNPRAGTASAAEGKDLRIVAFGKGGIKIQHFCNIYMLAGNIEK